MPTRVGSHLARTAGAAMAAILLLAACSDSTSQRSTTTTTTTTGESTGTTQQHSSGCRTNGQPAPTASPTLKEFDFEGAKRVALVAFPDEYDGTDPLPLLFSFHGHASSKEINEADSEMGKRGSARGFIVVTGDALGDPRQWNMFGVPGQPDDFAFINALAEELGDEWCVDLRRVFASGHSNGSAFTGFLGCVPPYRFAAIAMVAATIPSSCPPDHRPSVLALSGDADQTVPYDGGGVGGEGGVGIPPALETMQSYRDIYGCASEPKVDTLEPGVRRDSGVDCTDGARVDLITVIGGTHSWPGGLGASVDPNTSDAGRDFSATDAILDFFESVPPA